MPLWTDWKLDLTLDQILRGQGADPKVIHERRPQLVEVASRALAEGALLLSPRAAYEIHAVDRLQHERLHLAGGGFLAGPLIAQHLAGAQRVVAVVCSVGNALEEAAARLAEADPVFALALDGLGSAAAEALASEVARSVEDSAAEEGLEASLPLSPGMEGWPVGRGQAEVFALVDASEAGVTLTEAGMMVPRKSVSFVLGVGAGLATQANACDYCNLRQTCRYQDHFAG